jgi:hypothetical protein
MTHLSFCRTMPLNRDIHPIPVITSITYFLQLIFGSVEEWSAPYTIICSYNRQKLCHIPNSVTITIIFFFLVSAGRSLRCIFKATRCIFAVLCWEMEKSASGWILCRQNHFHKFLFKTQLKVDRSLCLCEKRSDDNNLTRTYTPAYTRTIFCC